MKIDDPKKRVAEISEDPADDFAPTLEQQVETLQAQVQALLAMKSTGGGLTDDRLEQILLRVTQMSADAHERAANPSTRLIRPSVCLVGQKVTGPIGEMTSSVRCSGSVIRWTGTRRRMKKSTSVIWRNRGNTSSCAQI